MQRTAYRVVKPDVKKESKLELVTAYRDKVWFGLVLNLIWCLTIAWARAECDAGATGSQGSPLQTMTSKPIAPNLSLLEGSG